MRGGGGEEGSRNKGGGRLSDELRLTGVVVVADGCRRYGVVSAGDGSTGDVAVGDRRVGAVGWAEQAGTWDAGHRRAAGRGRSIGLPGG